MKVVRAFALTMPVFIRVMFATPMETNCRLFVKKLSDVPKMDSILAADELTLRLDIALSVPELATQWLLLQNPQLSVPAQGP